MVQCPDDLLGSAYRERWDQEHALLGDYILDRLLELRERVRLGLVLTSAVGGLHQNIVRLADDGGVSQYRGAGPAEISREDQRPRGYVLLGLDSDFDDR